MMFDDDDFEAECDGYGTLRCYCGGDFCVCGMDDQPCGGCELCDHEDDDELSLLGPIGATPCEPS